MEKFKVENFFDISNCFFADIFNNINFVWDVIPKIKNYIKSEINKDLFKGIYHKETGVFIGEGTTIQEGATIIGPAIIGRNCFIGHTSLIRENCLLGDSVHLGHGAEIKNSIFLNKSKAAHLNYVGNSVIGNNVNISAGVVLANFRLDKKFVMVSFEKEKINTNLQKFGAIIGDNSNIGVNSVLNPGTILGKNNLVYPLLSVIGVHEDDEIIK